jgi:hypothetical protein
MEKKIMNLLKKLFIFIIVIGFMLVALGCLFPGLLWTKSLGVKYTEADYKKVMEKLGYSLDTNLVTESYTYGPPTAIDTKFTSEEITALINKNESEYYAIKNAQVKLNDDGTIEIVGSANTDYFLNEILGGKYTKEEVSSMLPIPGLLPSAVNIYLNLNGSVTNNKTNISINSVSVQGVEIPSSITNSYESINSVTEGLDNIILKCNNESGSSFDEIKVENGKLVFKGKIPSLLE